MNKSQKRAIQKHRAKARKFDARRKEGGNLQPAAASRPAQATAPRARPPARSADASAEPQT